MLITTNWRWGVESIAGSLISISKSFLGGGIYRGIINFYFKKFLDWDKMIYGLYPPPAAYKGIIIPAYRRAEIENDLTFL